ncbi:HET domain-containing protein [Candidatus Bathyarchaeota archaeon]|nr:HET domain-containing protein [Candidatus Bathyarchaeota archaeon]
MFLYESRGEMVSYATLSYCWGNTTALKTTRTNIEEHTRGISLSKFPETLRDAIRFARGLGFRYLWIDALCIIQGDASDWSKQARDMTAIYHGCALNIAVANAESGDAGMVHKLKDCSIRISTVSDLGFEFEDAADETNTTADIYAVSTPALSNAFQHKTSRLETRGWVFQETLVSVASVYVTHKGLEWACCRAQWTEDSDLSGFMKHTPKQMWKRDNANWVRSSSNLRENMAILRTLYRWVEGVTERYLSHSRDRLPSISGLTSRLAHVTGASYVAGLWKEDLAVGLTWSAIDPGAVTRHAGRAPSWSWASVDVSVGFIWGFRTGTYSPLSYHAYIVEGLALEVLDVRIDEVHPGSFGEVRGGRIVARGTMWPVTISNVGINGPFEHMYFSPDEARDRGDGFACWILYLTNYSRRTGDYFRHIQFLVVEESVVGVGEFCHIGIAGFALGSLDGVVDLREKESQKMLDTTGERRILELV